MKGEAKLTNGQRYQDIVLTRRLKSAYKFDENNDDVRIILKLRENRARIDLLKQQLWIENSDFDYEKDNDQDYLDNLSTIENMLNHMRKELAAL